MKRTIFLITVLIAGAMITMFSCTKDKSEITTQNESNDCPSCKTGIELANKINNFKQRLKYANENLYKDGDEMTKEEAVEGMELLINASHGFPAEQYQKISIDTVEIVLPLNEQGNIAVTDVETTYSGMQTLIKDVFDNTNYSDKHIVSVMLISGDDNVVKAITTTGEKGEDPGGNIFTDCWWYGEELGMCDYTGAGETDGGDALAEELFANRPSIFCPQGYHVVLSIEYSEVFEGNESICTGYIFYLQNSYGVQFTDSEKKLYANEMNYWYDQEFEFLFTTLPQSLNKPSNWLMASLRIDGNEHTDENYTIRWINHINMVTYGLAFCVKDEVLAPPTNP